MSNPIMKKIQREPHGEWLWQLYHAWHTSGLPRNPAWPLSWDVLATLLEEQGLDQEFIMEVEVGRIFPECVLFECIDPLSSRRLRP